MMPPKKLCKCVICDSEFMGWRVHVRFCSSKCVATYNKRNRKITRQLLERAEKEVPLGEDRSAWVLKQTGQCSATLTAAMKRLGYRWSPRVDVRAGLQATRQEQRYVQMRGCVICGEDRIVDAAHLFPAREGFQGWVPNILPLCPNHHSLYDRKNALSETEIETLAAFVLFKFTEWRKDTTHEDQARWSATVDSEIIDHANAA